VVPDITELHTTSLQAPVMDLVGFLKRIALAREFALMVTIENQNLHSITSVEGVFNLNLY